MIDTVRLRGPAEFYKFNADYERGVIYLKKDGTQYQPEVQVENKKDKDGNSIYRAWYYPSRELIDVEFNIHKILFKDNVYNYHQGSGFLNSLLRAFGGCFYGSGNYYVTRCDIGGVSTFDSAATAYAALEKYRRARLPGSRVNKYRHQNYPDSVFYYSNNWSMKIYNKGAEMGDNAKEFPHFDLFSTLRFEKTFRQNEMKRLGMQVKPHHGVHIDGFDVGLLLDNFYDTLANWELVTTPHVTDKKGMFGLLSVIENQGLLSDIESAGIVSRTSMWRYKQEKKANFDHLQKVVFTKNLPNNLLDKMNYFSTLGVAKLL